MGAFDRRSVLLLSLGVASASGVTCKKVVEDRPPEPGARGAPPDFALLAQVADRLFPPDDDTASPGAAALGAEAYFRGVWADARMRHVTSVAERGAGWLASTCQTTHNASFVALSKAQQDALLTTAQQTAELVKGISGVLWLRVMLSLTLEACFGDPRHGGNRNGEGFAFLGGVQWEGRR